MFDIEKEVPSLELCEKLKELGYPQTGGGLYWDTWGDSLGRPQVVLIGDWDDFWPIMQRLKEKYYIKAPTLREMGELLLWEREMRKEGLEPNLLVWKLPDKIVIRTPLFNMPQFEADTLPNVCAKMLIWLAENVHMSLGRKEANNNVRKNENKR